MLRFNIFYYLFAALAVLALVANARPTSSQPDTGSVAGMPGMAATMNHPDGQSTQHKETSVDMESNYMNEMEMALEAAQKVGPGLRNLSPSLSRCLEGSLEKF